MKKLSLIAVFITVSFWVNAQFSLSGKVTNSNGEPLIGASVQLNNSGLGAVTRLNGDYEFENIQAGEYTISASYMGYEKVSKVLSISKNSILNFELKAASFMADEVVVKSTRVGDKTPGASVYLYNEELNRQNLGQDLPYLMSLTPSFVSTSDGGAGVGYTGFRIRGTDANRINVTVNGIPINDAESHGVFWVNMPDFASSVEDIQIQRGVGTSTNGSGAFGASINMQTNSLEKVSYAEVNSSAGSFNTFKNTVKVGTGLLANHFAFDARISQISSDGFVDRAASNLKSYFASGGYYAENTMVKLNVFSGKETTYQAWNGVPKVRLENDLAGMQRYEDHWLYSTEQTQHMINSDSRTYNYYTYENETDNYQQDHFQLLFTQKIAKKLTFNSALHYTYGRGYYEQYRTNDELADYNIQDVIIGGDTLTTSDLVRQKWLDNDFYGFVASLNYTDKNLDVTLGGSANKYDGRQFGEVIWGKYLGEIKKDYEWYRNTGKKADANIYIKANYKISRLISLYGDLQYRTINHDMNGLDDDYRDITQQHEFIFVNPKGGLFFNIDNSQEAFILYAKGHREPNRSNFTDAVDATKKPTYESLNDFEAGYTFKKSKFSIGANAYVMLYTDQLILTGEINDVGSAIMTNVDKSYRRGIEIFGGVKIFETLSWDLNATLSQNKIKDFTEYVDNWDTGDQNATEIGLTDIAFSPSIIANNIIVFMPIRKMVVGFNTQYVGKQYIDNSMSEERMINAYLVNNLSVNYTMSAKNFPDITFSLLVNNLFNEVYESNAWIYSYNLGGERYAMDGYFPQAGTNFLAGVKMRF
jgi:iron complex outermembrane receptor protein